MSIIEWKVPREWEGERCFIIAGGPSVKEQEAMIPMLNGRIIAIKQSVALRPNADVMFIAGKDDPEVCAAFFPMFKGKYLVGRGPYKGVPGTLYALKRSTPPDKLSHDPERLAGYDAGTSAINLAYLFGAKEIILLGYDMTGGRWLNDRYKHHLPFPPQKHFDIHMSALPSLSKDLEDAGVKVINASPISAVTVFEKRKLEEMV